MELRFPEPLANPFLGFAVMLMVVLDGISSSIRAGDRRMFVGDNFKRLLIRRLRFARLAVTLRPYRLACMRQGVSGGSTISGRGELGSSDL